MSREPDMGREAPNCRCVAAPVFEETFAAELTEPVAREILRALETRVNWYEGRLYKVPQTVRDAIDAIAPVVTKFETLRLRREAVRIRREAEALIDAETERKDLARDAESREP